MYTKTITLRIATLVAGTFVLLTGGLSQARTLEEIRGSGKLNVGIAFAIPWVMTNQEGELLGSEIDLSLKLAADMGVKPSFSIVQWDQLIPLLADDAIDVVISGMVITPARALQVAFTRPYRTSATTVLARREGAAGKAASLEDLNSEGVRIGVALSTVGAEVATEQFPNAAIIEVPSFDVLITGLSDGSMDAIVTSKALTDYLARDSDGAYFEPLAKSLHEDVSGMAVAYGNDALLEFLNAWIAVRGADGYLWSNTKYWFEGSDWMSRFEVVAAEQSSSPDGR